MINYITMPRLSASMEEEKIIEWKNKPGDKIKKSEIIVVIESDKADMDFECLYEGYLATNLYEIGQVVPVDTILALIAETEAEIEEAQKLAPSLKGKKIDSITNQIVEQAREEIQPNLVTVAESIAPVKERIIATPRAKKLAKQYDVSLNNVAGSGIHGRIVAEDVLRVQGIESFPSILPQKTPSITPENKINSEPIAISPGTIQPFNTLQQAVIRNMVASLQVPTFHVGYAIATDAIKALYQQIKSKGVTMTALLAKAVAITLQKHPLLNASYTDSGIQYHSAINIAIAVSMSDGGLITPVLENADRVDIYSLSRTWQALVTKAKARQLQPEQYTNGTFTLSNLGMFGVDRFDAILPPGQGAILAVGSARPQVTATPEGAIPLQHQMNVNITCDHRVIYGADAAAFLQDLAQLIEVNPQILTY